MFIDDAFICLAGPGDGRTSYYSFTMSWTVILGILKNVTIFFGVFVPAQRASRAGAIIF